MIIFMEEQHVYLQNLNYVYEILCKMRTEHRTRPRQDEALVLLSRDINVTVIMFIRQHA